MNPKMRLIISVADPFGSVSFWSAGSGSASMKRIRILVAKNQPKSWNISTKIIRISYIFFKTIKLMLTDINIYSINNKTRVGSRNTHPKKPKKKPLKKTHPKWVFLGFIVFFWISKEIVIFYTLYHHFFTN